ncbi:hypothetical protein LTR70_002702 [Exophiala xenobiotica]|uniref:Short-chain dehydrogenase n=1 Tax=Lithohypha guttulata TaxID=1690604 RepID=A0ABR0KKK1_9EURO|nr:hypothetical protein LTR24_001808 [Lithohypha guttulata]KAK5324628.1 hypothetical protein LTR70_002702 [Exophiala xenobiotica]
MTSTTHSDFDKATEASDVAAAFPQAIKDRTILVTGVNRQGIGYTTAEAFASQAPRCLILAGRSEAKIKECIEELQAQYSTIDIRSLIVDLSSQKAVRAAASEFLSWSDVPAVDLLINNAGMMRHGETFEGEVPVNEDGIEEMFATNHLGHFLFANLIVPKIIASAKRPGSTRIINLSSSGTYVSLFRASDIAWEKPASQLPENERPSFGMMRQAGMEVNENMSYIPTAAYGHTKTCNILFSVGLNERFFSEYGILSLALNPGEVKTELGRNTDSAWLDRMIKRREAAGIHFWKTQRQGASTTLVAACDPKLGLPGSDGSGVLLSDCQIWRAPPYAVDKSAAEKLWKLSEELVGQEFAM